MSKENGGDGRLSFDEAATLVQQTVQAAFVAVPVFGEDAESAEGERVFILMPDAKTGYALHFVAGPFFVNAYGANEVVPHGEIPEAVRELRFLPTRCEEAWLDEQIQVLIARLVQAAGLETRMPDYAGAPAPGAAPGTVFPISFIGTDPKSKN